MSSKLSNESENNATIEAYNHEAISYIHETPPTYRDYHKSMLNWINAAISSLEGDVLEIGSATPRDAQYIRSHGIKVQTSDASRGLVRHLRSTGEDAILLNALTDEIPNGYGLIFANAVAPHFTYSNMVKFLEKIEKALSPNARLAFNLKRGNGETWINEKFQTKRFTRYWQPAELKRLLANYQFEIIFMELDASGDRPNHHWINIVLVRK